MSDEVWREIRGYERCYEVSDHGRVRSLTGLPEKWREGSISGAECADELEAAIGGGIG